jgi:hypothetical protein
LWSVGDDQSAALEGEGRSVRHEICFGSCSLPDILRRRR